jgi:hypothetical protein
VGDKVYKICPVSNFIEFGDMRNGHIVKTNCQRCAYGGCECYNIGYQKGARNIVKDVTAQDELWIVKRKQYFGKIYFNTPEEAERALKESSDTNA